MEGTQRSIGGRRAFDDSFVSTSSGSVFSSPEGSTSTVAFINAQIVAHGFARSPGLKLDGLAHEDQEVTAKCLLGMLQQRMDDLKRSEELSGKLRTLNYENERMSSLYSSAKDDAANAEREMELAKSRMNAALRTLTKAEHAHKQTNVVLSKTQTSLQFNRSTSLNEIKRKEKEVEKIMEKWAKIINDQARLGSVGTGIECANLAIDASPLGPREHPILEQALSDSEATRIQLQQENDNFREVLLSCAKSMQILLWSFEGPQVELKPLITSPQLFSHDPKTSLYDPSAHSRNAHSKLRELLGLVQTKIENEREELLKKAYQKEERDRVSSEQGSMQAKVDSLTKQVQDLQQKLNEANSPMNDAANRRVIEEAALATEREMIVSAETHIKRERIALEAAQDAFMEEQRQWRANRVNTLHMDSPETKKERKMDDELGNVVSDVLLPAGVEPGSGRTHRIRRSRHSLGSPSSSRTVHESAPKVQDVGHTQLPNNRTGKKVAFTASTISPQHVPSLPIAPSFIPPPITSASSANLSNRLSSETQTAPIRSDSGQNDLPFDITPPPPPKNPFDEVLLLSAQRSRPVFATSNSQAPTAPFSMPIFGGLTTITENSPTLEVDSPLLPLQPTNPSSLASNGATNSQLPPNSSNPTSSKSPSKPKRSPSRHSRGISEDGTPLTPPIFTHRRIVGKKHQYAPVHPSPLSKVLSWTADSSVNSNSSERSRNSLPKASSAKIPAFNVKPLSTNITGASEETRPTSPSQDEEWQVEELDPGIGPSRPLPAGNVTKSTPLAPKVAIILPRDQPPLSEKELTLKPRRPVVAPSRSSKQRSPSKPKRTVTTSAAQSRKPSSDPLIAGTKVSKGKEKENIATENLPERSIPLSSPIKGSGKQSTQPRAIPGRVIMGKSTSKAVTSTSSSNAEPSKLVADKRKTEGVARRLRPPPATGPGASRR